MAGLKAQEILTLVIMPFCPLAGNDALTPR